MFDSIKNKIEQRIIRKEGGMKESVFLRNKYKKQFHVDVDMYSYGGCFSPSFNLGGEVKIGRFCSIASNVRFLAGNHPYDRVSMSPYFYLKSWGLDLDEENKISYGRLEIGHDVWIGENVLILSNVRKIGNGSIIGAGSVVTHDVPPYAIVCGTPAKCMKMRFTEEEIDALEKSEWYNFSPKQLEPFIQYMNDPLVFGEKICDRRKNEYCK